MKYINIHTHKQSGNENVLQIVNIDNLESFCKNDKFYSLGFHPWLLKTQNINDLDFKLLEELSTNKNIIAIGETGIDRHINVSVEKQIELLDFHISLAGKLNKALIIHCVRAYSDFLQILKNNSKQIFIFHNFNSNYETAKKLIEKGAFLSFGTALLRNRKLQDVFVKLAGENVFLENDDSCFDIVELYKFASEVLKTDSLSLQKKIYNNFNKVFPIIYE